MQALFEVSDDASIPTTPSPSPSDDDDDDDAIFDADEPDDEDGDSSDSEYVIPSARNIQRKRKKRRRHRRHRLTLVKHSAAYRRSQVSHDGTLTPLERRTNRAANVGGATTLADAPSTPTLTTASPPPTSLISTDSAPPLLSQPLYTPPPQFPFLRPDNDGEVAGSTTDDGDVTDEDFAASNTLARTLHISHPLLQRRLRISTRPPPTLPTATGTPITHCQLTFGPAPEAWTCDHLDCSHGGTPHLPTEQHYRCIHDYSLCETCAEGHYEAHPATEPLVLPDSAIYFDATGRETLSPDEGRELYAPTKERDTVNPYAYVLKSIAKVCYTVRITHPCCLVAPLFDCATCLCIPSNPPLLLLYLSSSQPLPTATTASYSRVDFFMRGSWYDPTSPNRQLCDQVFPSTVYGPRGQCNDPAARKKPNDSGNNVPTIVRLWTRQPELMLKSLTCSLCGPSAYTYWTCSDDGCHIGLCVRCYGQARYPGEAAPLMPEVQPGVDYLCAQMPACCGDFTQRGTGINIVPKPFTANDKSYVHIPAAVVTLLGFGNDEWSSGIEFASRTSTFALGLGTHAFAITFNKVHTSSNTIAQHVQRIADIIRRTPFGKLVIDARCHNSATGYAFNHHTYNPLQLYNTFLLPLIQSFHDAHTHYQLGSPSPTDILIVIHVCEANTHTWDTILRDAAIKGIRFEFLTFKTPFLMSDTHHTLPLYLPIYLNRLIRADTESILRHTSSLHFVTTYRPELFTWHTDDVLHRIELSSPSDVPIYYFHPRPPGPLLRPIPPPTHPSTSASLDPSTPLTTRSSPSSSSHHVATLIHSTPLAARTVSHASHTTHTTSPSPLTLLASSATIALALPSTSIVPPSTAVPAIPLHHLPITSTVPPNCLYVPPHTLDNALRHYFDRLIYDLPTLRLLVQCREHRLANFLNSHLLTILLNYEPDLSSQRHLPLHPSMRLTRGVCKRHYNYLRALLQRHDVAASHTACTASATH